MGQSQEGHNLGGRICAREEIGEGWKGKLMPITLLNDVINPEPKSLSENKGVFAAPAVAREALAKRLDTLDGKTVYLVDIGYGGSYKFMQAIERWFRNNLPSVTTVRKRKAGSAFRDDCTELLDDIKARGHAAVIGVGG